MVITDHPETAQPSLAPSISGYERDAVLAALRAGVVPAVGQRHIQVGRGAELEALVADQRRMVAGDASLRLVVGDYGAGKSFFLAMARATAHRQNLVTMNADVGAGHRLYSTTGASRALLAELTRSTATLATPGGGGLAAVVERAIAEAGADRAEGEADPVAEGRLQPLLELRGGADFVAVVELYRQAHRRGDATLQSRCLRWLRGEYRTITEAREALGIRAVVDDSKFYDHLKLIAALARIGGYAGLLVTLDEMGSLARLANPRARAANYDQILRILNDTLQGGAAGIGFLLAGTPDWVTDPRRGLHSDPALRSRLSENTLVAEGADLTGPAIRLRPLTREDLYLLLCKVAGIHAYATEAVTGPEIEAFLAHRAGRLGHAAFSTPRDTIRDFLHALAARDAHPELSWPEAMSGTARTKPDPPGGGSSNAPSPPSQATHPAPSRPQDDDLEHFDL